MLANVVVRFGEAILVLCLVFLGAAELKNLATKIQFEENKDLKALKILYTTCDYKSCSNSSCYVLLADEGNYQEQRERCRMLQSDAEFFEESDPKKFKEVIDLLKDQNRLNFWTGAVVCPKRKRNFWIKSKTKLPNWVQIPPDVSSSSKCEYLSYSSTEGFSFNQSALALCSIGNIEYGFGTGSPDDISPTTVPQLPTSQGTETTVTTTPTTTTVVNTKETTSTLSLTTSVIDQKEFCEEKKYDVHTFKKTHAGGVAMVNCPDGYSGEIKWKCSMTSPPRFIPEIPIFGCVPKWLEEMEDRAKTEPPLDVVQDLTTFTQDGLEYGKVIADVLNVLDILRLRFFDENSNDTLTGEAVLNFTNQVVGVTSNCIDPKNKVAWTRMDEKYMKTCFGNVLNVVEKVGGKVLCNDATTNNSANGTISQDHSIELETIKVANSTDLTYSPKGIGNQITLPHTNLNPDDYCNGDPVALGVFYKKVDHIWKNFDISISSLVENRTGEPPRRILNSPVIALSLKSNSIHRLKEHSTITLEKLVKQEKEELLCVFWDHRIKNWNHEGCSVDEEHTNKTHTVCNCNHLTNFAVLMTLHKEIPVSVPMGVLSIVCSGLSIMALTLTIACLRGFRSLRCRRSVITCNLCFALMMVNFMVLVGVSRTENTTVCRIMAILLHFFLLSAFFWMLVEGYFLYQMIVVVFSKVLNIPMSVFYAVGYGLPFMIVGVSSGIGFQLYNQDHYCWLSTSKGMVWSFLGPLCFVIVVNTGIFIVALKTAMKVRKSKLHKSTNAQQGWLKGSFSTMCLLGITWILTFTHFIDAEGFSNYIFIILNGLQGVFIFVSHILFNERNRTTVVRFLVRRGSKYSTSQGTSSTRTQRTDRGSSIQSGKRPTPSAPDMIHFNPQTRY